MLGGLARGRLEKAAPMLELGQLEQLELGQLSVCRELRRVLTAQAPLECNPPQPFSFAAWLQVVSHCERSLCECGMNYCMQRDETIEGKRTIQTA